MKVEIEWIKVTPKTLPKPKITVIDGFTMKTASVGILCFDGKTVFKETYAFDNEDDTKWFLDHVTHYVEVNNIPKPIEP